MRLDPVSNVGEDMVELGKGMNDKRRTKRQILPPSQNDCPTPGVVCSEMFVLQTFWDKKP
jgi:hypothetical protein